MTDQPRPMDADETLSPVDLPGSTVPDGRPLRWTSGVIAVAAAFLLVCNAATIDDWANELPPGPWTARLTAATARWAAATTVPGAPRAWLHEHWKQGQSAKFPEPASDPGLTPE